MLKRNTNELIIFGFTTLVFGALMLMTWWNGIPQDYGKLQLAFAISLIYGGLWIAFACHIFSTIKENERRFKL